MYLALAREPSLSACLVLFGVTLAAAVGARLWGHSRALVILTSLVAFAAAGLTNARVRTLLVAAPVLQSAGKVAQVEGWVVDVIGRGQGGPRMLLAPVRVSGLESEQVPARLRVTLPSGAVIGPGAPVRLTALLNPPPPPASPGAYDFARDAYFQRVGGAGLALKPPAIIALAPPSLGLRVSMAVNAARWSLSRRIVSSMGERTGGIAVAMVTGHEAWLNPDDVAAMRDSGLAHVLSISGLHMAVVGGFVFALVRLAIALWPWLALRVSGKKVAAIAALAAVVAYLIVSGRPPPAERSAVTAGTAFLAILLDRRALSLHALAVAALVVLTLQPEAIAQPGFQMSFAATAALLALAESWPRREGAIRAPWPIVAVEKARGWLIAAIAASLVAGLATEPFAIQHFNRITLYGLPANLVTEPISSLLIMPTLAIGAVASLFGLGDAPLAVAGLGIEGLTAAARRFAAAPRAVLIVASAPEWTLAASFLGLLFVCIWRGRLRWLGVPLFAAVVIVPRQPPPGAWIAADGAAIAIHQGKQAIALRPKAQRFATELWSRRRGLMLPKVGEQLPTTLYDCSRDRCFPTPVAPVKVAAWWRRKPPSDEALAELCASPAELVVLRAGSAPAESCSGKQVIDEPALAAGGSAEVYRDANGWRVAWSRPLRGERPWTTRASDTDE